MKKFLTSFFFLAVFVAYAAEQHFGNSAQIAPIIADITPIAEPAPISIPVPTPRPIPTPTPIPVSTPVPPPPPKPKGQYIDGTYTGSVADAYYGNVQVRATVSGGAIVDVAFLQYPNDRNTSRNINSRAMPILRSEAIRAQSAQVNTVSGASDTSGAFRQSLAVALSGART